MESTKELPGDTTTQQYNEIPVYFCSKCLSLNIRDVEGKEYCDDCGNTHVLSSTIEGWERHYADRYGAQKVLKPSGKNK